MWFAILPFSIVGSSLALWNAHNMVTRQWERSSLEDVELINKVVNALGIYNYEYMRNLDNAINGLDPAAIKSAVNSHQIAWKNSSLFVIKDDGQIIASAQAIEAGAKAYQPDSKTVLKEKWFQSAMAGIPNSSATSYDNSANAYGISAVPIRASDGRQTGKPIGVLALQTRLSMVDYHSGLDAFFATNINNQPNLGNLIDLDKRRNKGIAALLIFKPGKVHFIGHPEFSDSYRKRMLDPAQVKNSRWWPVVEAALQPGPTHETKLLTIDDTGYVLAIRRDSPERSVALLIDQGTKFRNVDDLFAWFWLVNLIALSLSSLAIYRISSALSEPIDKAGKALAAISQGDFETKLPEESSDVGKLFSYINQASSQLKCYLEDATRIAVTEAQINQARRIQDDFLIKDLPSRPEFSLAASFDPAYVIGADWYDAINLDDTLYFVVADVCDKGIPSALYMSVFRSLLRHNITNEHKSRSNRNAPREVILNSLSDVNRYMAINHGKTAMFATVFIGAYTIKNHQLSYILAGHEAPLLLRGQQLEALKLSGPAVGLFHDCVFMPHHCQLDPGSMLLAYSDGLPDSRDHDGVAFGDDHIRTILCERTSQEWSATDLLQRLRQAALDHIGSGDHFDDLTLMTLKIEANSINTENRDPCTASKAW